MGRLCDGVYRPHIRVKEVVNSTGLRRLHPSAAARNPLYRGTAYKGALTVRQGESEGETGRKKADRQ